MIVVEGRLGQLAFPNSSPATSKETIDELLTGEAPVSPSDITNNASGKLKQTPPSAGSDSSLVVARGSGVEMTPSLSLVPHHREGSKVSEPLNILPLAVIEEPLVRVEASD